MRLSGGSLIKLSGFAIAGLLLYGLTYGRAQVLPQPGPPIPIACAYNTSPATLTDGQAGWAQCDSSGKLLTSSTAGTTAVTQSGTWTVQPGNTANTTPWLITEAGDSFTNITTNTDTIVKASAGTIKRIVVNAIGTTSSAVVYNNTTCTGTKIATLTTLIQNSVTLNVAATVGICVTTAGAAAADITVTYR